MKYLAITAILYLILTGASFAGNVTMTEVITGGNLTLTMPSNFSFPSATLGGSSQRELDTEASYYVEDSRGSGVGWNLGFQISQFTTGGTQARTLPVANFYSIFNDSVYEVVYGQNVDATNGPKEIVSSVNIQSSEVKCIQTQAGYGMGKYRILPGHKLFVDANAYAGTYTATLTTTLNAVP